MTPTDPSTGDEDSTTSTRRAFIGTTATLGTLALAGCAGTSDDGGDPTTSAMATDEPTATQTPTETAEEMAAPDVPILNYALTLEHLENAFYRDGLDEFSDDELMGANALSAFSETVRMQVPDYLATIGAHEAAHVEALSGTVSDLGGEPVGEAEYDFGYQTPSEFLAVGMALENTGVSAYAGAAPMVVNNDVLGAAAGIHSVEARHAAFLNLVNSESPFPAGVDEARSIEEVLEIAGQFVTSDVAAPEISDDRPQPDRKADDDTSDLQILNYALTLEHLEHAFYRDGLEMMSDGDLASADVLADYGSQVQDGVADHLRTVRDHEAAHVQALTGTIEDLGGDPVAEASYNFGYQTPSEFLGVAKALENTGVAAYKGAAPSVSNDQIFAAAIGIHSVEARHASFLNELNVASPFPAGVDEPMTMQEVTEVAGQFIEG